LGLGFQIFQKEISNLFFFVTGTIFVPVEIGLVTAWVLAYISSPHHDVLETLPRRIKEQFMAQKSAVGVQYKRRVVAFRDGVQFLVGSKRLLTDHLMITPSLQRKLFTAQVDKISIPA